MFINMSLKNYNPTTTIDSWEEWYNDDDMNEDNIEIFPEDDMNEDDNSTLLEDEYDIENNRLYVSKSIRTMNAPIPIDMTLTKKKVKPIVEKDNVNENQDSSEYIQMKTKLTWLNKPILVKIDDSSDDDSDSEYVESVKITEKDDNDYPSLSSEMFKNKKKIFKEIKREKELAVKEVIELKGWKTIVHSTKVIKKVVDNENVSLEFTKPCSSWIDGGGKCIRKNCKYAHSEKELKIINCSFSNCNLVIEKDGYFSNKNSDRFCNKIHIGEKVDNFFERIGLRKSIVGKIPSELEYALSLLSKDKHIEFEGVKYFGKLSTKDAKNSNDVKSDKQKEKTQLCRSIRDNVKCPHKNNCRFAHNFNELVVLDCGFNEKCRGVNSRQGKYTNSDNQKVCYYRHPNETKDNK